MNNPLNEEAAVQDGLNKWREGHHGCTPTWKVLIDAMSYAGVAVQHIEGLKTELCQQLMGTCFCSQGTQWHNVLPVSITSNSLL